MEFRKIENGYLLKLFRGEKVITSIVEFCQQQSIFAGWLTGVGAVCNAEIGYYDFKKREYFFKTVPEDREVASLTGNIALADGKPFCHAHAVLSSCDELLSCVGGHIKEAEVAVTLEVLLRPFERELRREYDEETGLKLLAL